MKRALAVLVVTLCFIGLTYAQKDVQDSCVPATPPEIDGLVNDWPMEWNKDPDNKFLYNICNDAENLYIRLKVSDDMTQGKIGRFGLTVWLDPKGKKKRDLGLKYPTPTGRDFNNMPDRGDARNASVQQRDQMRLQMKQDLIKDVEVLELIGLAKENVVSARLGIMNGIKVTIVMDEQGAYVYEAKIPFKAFRLNKASIPTLGVGFETGKLAQAAPSGAPPIGTGNGYSGSAARGRQGGARQGGGQRYNEMSKETKFWASVKLN